MKPLRVKGVKLALTAFLFYCGVEATVGLWGSSFLVDLKGRLRLQRPDGCPYTTPALRQAVSLPVL
ncbi:hypothetical protein LJK87_09895 [Paenibacillus sp. P25]|nr:hypothetical protein LJK87_09895 [Paenibacillus sp. P25]